MPLLLLSLCWLPRRVMPYSALVALIADLLSRVCDGYGANEQPAAATSRAVASAAPGPVLVLLVWTTPTTAAAPATAWAHLGVTRLVRVGPMVCATPVASIKHVDCCALLSTAGRQ